MSSITDEEWDRLWQADPFETARLLWLIDKVDWRGHGDFRTEILNLHRLAMDVFNQGRRQQVGELFELALDLDERVRDELGDRFDPVKRVLSDLTDLCPESLSYDDSEGLRASD
ncbi:transposase [Aquabacterium sp.]|uniref:transposase n=1 Tax=Aquabacterium sp. TaxID=1872578 RepID=UPI0035B121A5